MAVSTAQNAEVGEITERVLDAAPGVFCAGRCAPVTMNSIADQAGVGVATVYRRFPKKEQLLQAVLVREAAFARRGPVRDRRRADLRRTNGRRFRHVHPGTRETNTASQRLPPRTWGRSTASEHESLLALGRAAIATIIRFWQGRRQVAVLRSGTGCRDFCSFGPLARDDSGRCHPAGRCRRGRAHSCAALLPLVHLCG